MGIIISPSWKNEVNQLFLSVNGFAHDCFNLVLEIDFSLEPNSIWRKKNIVYWCSVGDSDILNIEGKTMSVVIGMMNFWCDGPCVTTKKRGIGLNSYCFGAFSGTAEAKQWPHWSSNIRYWRKWWHYFFTALYALTKCQHHLHGPHTHVHRSVHYV